MGPRVTRYRPPIWPYTAGRVVGPGGKWTWHRGSRGMRPIYGISLRMVFLSVKGEWGGGGRRFELGGGCARVLVLRFTRGISLCRL